MSELVLSGLDGKNPLGFLAALGALGALSERVKGGQPAPRLLWRLQGTYRPVLLGGPEREGLLDVLEQDVHTFREEPAILGLRYEKSDGKPAHDLKPPPGFYARYLAGLVGGAARSLAAVSRSASFAAAFGTDVACDNNGNTKPTALHFTAGQQELLTMVSELTEGVTRDDLAEALFGPWRYERPLPVLGWDNTMSRDYALRASDPSKEKKLGVPGADWLAFRGLPFVRVAPVGDSIETTGCTGGWKTGRFRWPLWGVPLSAPVIAALLVSPEVAEAHPATMAARGVSIVFESAIRRSDQGGYGSFAPAQVARRGGPL